MSYLFVVLATTILLLFLKIVPLPGITWGWVLFPILGSLVMWLLFIGSVTTVGLIWPVNTWAPGRAPQLISDKYKIEKLRVAREFIPEEFEGMRYNTGRTASYEQKQAYYRKALALELATLAHDAPGFIEWEKRGETLIGELKILVKNEQ